MNTFRDNLHEINRLAKLILPTKEKRFHFNKEDNCCYVRYIYGIDIFKTSIMIRCPNANWHYYLAIDIAIHSKEPTLSNKEHQSECDILPCGKCYSEGSALAGSKLWDEFVASGYNEEVIWKELETWYNRNNV